jgi:biopolymer transport protein ExbB/TolQ
MQLVLAGVVLTRVATWTVQIHNRVWRDVRKAIRKTREFKERGWTEEAVQHALEALEQYAP